MRIDEDIADQFARWGVPVPTDAIQEDEGEMFEVWASNWDALLAFLAVETQWRIAAGVGALIWIGLDYSAVDVAFRRLGIGDDAFAAVQQMERAALDVFARAD